MLIDNDDRCYGPKDLEVFNLLKHPIWVFDIERKAMYWANQSALEIWNADSLLSLLSRDFASDMSQEVNLRQIDALVKITRKEIVNEQWTFYPKGRAATLDITCSAIRIDGGRIACLSEPGIPDNKAIEESTLRGVEMLRHLPFAVSQFSIEGKLLYQNPEAVNLFGTSTAETSAEGKANDMIFFINRFTDVDLGKAALQQVQAGNDFSAEVQQHTQTGPRWFSVALRRTRDPVTSNYVILHSARDISEIIKARKETVQASMKSEFMAVMAHEIRTPLHQIVGFLELLELLQPTKEQLDSILDIKSSSALLMSIINDLLDYSKLESGQVQVESISFPLGGLLQGCLASVKPDADKKGLALQSNLANDLPIKIIGDPNRLRQILLNLLSNAVKFTDQGYVRLTVVCVQRSGDEQRLRFEVTDTGIGVDLCDQTIIFEKYRQASASTARHFGGTGLGLSICKSLAELMGGIIGIVSQVGKGSTMFFEIPFQLSFAMTESVKCEDQTTSLEVTQKLRLLVVEDNKINQKVVRSMLERMGHTVDIAENGLLALDRLRRASYNLVLMDIQMPVMDGIECTKQIRSVLGQDKARLPIIGLTASFQHSDLNYYLEIGMSDCLGKPMRMEHLNQSISRAMQRAHGTRWNQCVPDGHIPYVIRKPLT